MGLATAADRPNCGFDDRVLLQTLDDRGIDVSPVVWSDTSLAWDAYELIVIRSCWDYHRRPDAFRSWIDSLASLGVDLWNPPATVRWNLEKTYLKELASEGVRTVPTAVIEQDSPRQLETVLRDNGWTEAVLKPAIAGTAYLTSRVSLESVTQDQPQLNEIITHSDALVQPFIPEIKTAGEWSLIFIGGQFSHSIIKHVTDDFRVQSEFGGTVVSKQAPKRFIDEASRIIDNIRHDTHYARVDGVVVDGEFTLMELELIEPELFFRQCPSATERFTDLVIDALER